MNKIYNRDISFDFLRSITILSAIAIHYHIKVYIGFLIKFFNFSFLFTIGGLFFFISGFMSYLVYYPRFLKNPQKTSIRLYKKAFFIFFIYVGYIIFMYILTSSTIPNNIIDFLLQHSFFAKVLLTFSFLYLLIPFFLFVYHRNYILFLFIFLCLIFFNFFLDKHLLGPISILLISNSVFGYPLIPYLIVYNAGFILGHTFCNFNFINKKTFHYFSLAIIFGAFIFYLFKTSSFKDLMRDKKVFVFWESVSPFLCWIAIKPYIVRLTKFRLFNKFLTIGQNSLTFFILGNLFISLMDISPDSNKIIRGLGLIVIFILSYIFTFWHLKSKERIKIV